MSDSKGINRALAKLDFALRTQRIDRADFRSRRRQLLEDFEDSSCVTTPEMRLGELSSLDPELMTKTPKSDSYVNRATTSTPVAPLIAGVAAVGLIAVALWWFFSGRQENLPTDGLASVEHAMTAAPLEAANHLLDSDWSEPELRAFLQRWNTFADEALRAANDDSRLWLLRGETDRRLRAARDTQMLNASNATQARIELLEQVQTAIRLRQGS